MISYTFGNLLIWFENLDEKRVAFDMNRKNGDAKLLYNLIGIYRPIQAIPC